MLLLCSGEDSYQALQKARELETAFREKYDKQGQAVERLPNGKEGVEALLMAATGGSLFATRRFFRVDNLLSGCPKGRVDALVATLSRDAEQTIVVSKEEGVLSDKILKPFRGLPGFVQYDFSALSPSAFLKWATQHAASKGVRDTALVQRLAEHAAGDAWMFVTEIEKRQGQEVGGGDNIMSVGEKRATELTVYDVIDRLLMRTPDRWAALRTLDDPNAVVAMAVGQARSLLLVRAGHAQGVHPYVARKLARLQVADAAGTFRRTAAMIAWSRTGRSSAEEALDVLG
jgi:hypothetical protein